MMDEYQFSRRSIIVFCDQLSGIMITLWESSASDLQYHVFFLGAGLARTGSRDSDLITGGFTESPHRDPTAWCGGFTVFQGKPLYARR
jgi:hypothetical protein